MTTYTIKSLEWVSPTDTPWLRYSKRTPIGYYRACRSRLTARWSVFIVFRGFSAKHETPLPGEYDTPEAAMSACEEHYHNQVREMLKEAKK